MVIIDDNKNKRILNVDLDEQVHDTKNMELETITHRWQDDIQKESFMELQSENCISNFAIYILKKVVISESGW